MSVYLEKSDKFFIKHCMTKKFIYYVPGQKLFNPGLARRNRVFVRTPNQLLRKNGLKKLVISNIFFDVYFLKFQIDWDIS